ncbi:MAG TPA: NUDIX domain-containing protein [Anaerolineales bacterium]|nr:NUDIX domain-containing protein [Anaerolineales bacterium]
MEYILQLRQYIGHGPILLVGAAILILDEQDRLLMMKRSDNQCWGIPGGAIEPGEMLEIAAKRETLEETNLEIVEMSLFGAFSGPELYYKYPNGDEVYNVSVVYLSREWRGKVRLNDEHSEWKWFAASDIPADISPPIRPVITQFRSSFSKSNAVKEL